MTSGNYEFQSDFAKKYLAKGRTEGRAEGRTEGEAKGHAEGRTEGEARGRAGALLAVLEARGLVALGAARARILACTDGAQLDAWIRKAVTVASIDKLL